MRDGLWFMELGGKEKEEIVEEFVIRFLGRKKKPAKGLIE